MGDFEGVFRGFFSVGFTLSEENRGLGLVGRCGWDAKEGGARATAPPVEGVFLAGLFWLISGDIGLVWHLIHFRDMLGPYIHGGVFPNVLDGMQNSGLFQHGIRAVWDGDFCRLAGLWPGL